MGSAYNTHMKSTRSLCPQTSQTLGDAHFLNDLNQVVVTKSEVQPQLWLDSVLGHSLSQHQPLLLATNATNGFS